MLRVEEGLFGLVRGEGAGNFVGDGGFLVAAKAASIAAWIWCGPGWPRWKTLHPARRPAPSAE
jgi:hypothetical protein